MMSTERVVFFLVQMPVLIITAGMIPMLWGHIFGPIISFSALPYFVGALWWFSREPRPDGASLDKFAEAKT